MEKYWFKNRELGTGWRPANWQGWATTGVYIVSLILTFSLLGEELVPLEGTLRGFFMSAGALTFLFLIIVWRTGEPLEFKMGTTAKPHEK